MHKPIWWVETNISSAEFAEWLAYEQEYGLPDQYFAVARICSVVEGLVTRPRAAQAYVPYFKEPPRLQSPAETRSILRAHLAAVKARTVNSQRV